MNSFPYDLGVLATEKQVILFSNAKEKEGYAMHAGASSDGLHFKRTRKNPCIEISKDVYEQSSSLRNFRISQGHSQFHLLYEKVVDESRQLYIAFSKDGIQWKNPHPLRLLHEPGMIVPQYTHNDNHVMFYGESEIFVAYSENLTNWDVQRNPVLSPRNSYFDNHPIEIGSVMLTKKGILVIYYSKTRYRNGYTYAVGAALFDKKNPSREIWRSSKPIWEQGENWKDKLVYPMGAVNFKEKLLLYFGTYGEGVYAISFANINDIFDGKALHKGPKIEKHNNNPIIAPVLKHSWEASATFNAAAIYEAGKVHILYRAMGPANTSVIGYAASSDGITIDERLDEPIYWPTEEFEYPGKNPSICFMSGGGYGGCEDPRITKIDDTIYMTYVAYNGVEHPKVALTSIKVDDFVNKRWKWAKPKLISHPSVVNKNCVIFPEKIQGKYAVIHRIFPNVLLDLVDDLDFDERYLEGHHIIPPRKEGWDSRKLGAGAPPIKTDEGWLLIYQAVDNRDPGKYKIGAMLMDLNEPWKVLYRAHSPILEPTEWYENEGFKGGVAYPCGAVVMGDRLIVYYGGADTVICAASQKLDIFLAELKASSPVKAKPILYPQLVEYSQEYLTE